MFKKFFTLQEANRMLPSIRRTVGEILAKGQKLRTLLDAAQDQTQTFELQRLSTEIETLMAQLEQRGCFYKDWNFEIGLVDFPAEIDEEEVLLCWRSDEVEILWYHSMEDGYLGRRPLPAEWLLKDVF